MVISYPADVVVGSGCSVTFSSFIVSSVETISDAVGLTSEEGMADATPLCVFWTLSSDELGSVGDVISVVCELEVLLPSVAVTNSGPDWKNIMF